MPRRWSIDEHPKKKQIIKAICEGKESLRSIAAQYELSLSAARRYIEERISEKVATAKTEQDKADGKAVLEQLDAIMSRMRKLYDACDEWLQDPNNPDRYFLGPRANEVDIVYQEQDGDKLRTSRASLETILGRMRDTSMFPVEVKYRYADPRKLIIDNAQALTKQLELLAKIEGAVKDTVINVTINEKYLALKAIIIQATKGHPDVQARIAELIEKET